MRACESFDAQIVGKYKRWHNNYVLLVVLCVIVHAYVTKRDWCHANGSISVYGAAHTPQMKLLLAMHSPHMRCLQGSTIPRFAFFLKHFKQCAIAGDGDGAAGAGADGAAELGCWPAGGDAKVIAGPAAACSGGATIAGAGDGYDKPEAPIEGTGGYWKLDAGVV